MQPESLSGSSAYISDTNYDAAGRVTSRALGNGLTQSYAYYGWSEKVNSTIGQGGRLKTLSTGSLQNLAYQYDPAGNITQIFDSQAGETQVYTYDPLDRLTSWTMNNLLQESYTYNASTGNLDNKAGVTLTYTDSNHDHAVTGAGGNSYDYDANPTFPVEIQNHQCGMWGIGNQITRVIGADTFNLKYNAENQLVEVKKNSVVMATFVYDGDGRQVKATVDNIITHYVGTHYEVKNPGTGQEITKYYFAGAARIAMRRYVIPQPMTLNYLLSDHLGSTSLVTDNTGALVSEARYKPCPLAGMLREGEVRYTKDNSPLPTLYNYTGQRSYVSDLATGLGSSGFGLMYYNARWYDPYLKHFVSPDSLVPDPYNSLDYNRYAYTRYNPVKYTDSTGHWVDAVIDGAFIGMDIYDIQQNGLNWVNGLSLAADVISAALPIVTGGGLAVRAFAHADDAIKVANAADNIIDTANAIDTAVDAGNATDNLADAVNAIDDIPCSFSSDTSVATQDGEVSISAIEIGDYVLAWNEADGTLGYYPVTAVLTHEDQALTEVIIDGEWLETTPEHPFYTEESGWLPAGELRTGMHVRQADGTTGLVWLKWTVYRQQEMYNLTVANAHTFFVGDGQWLVHNTCRSVNDLRPDPTATGPHSTFKRDPVTGNVTNYATWQQNPYTNNWQWEKRFDGVGKPHMEYDTHEYILPHVHDPSVSNKYVRRPYEWEIPR